MELAVFKNAGYRVVYESDDVLVYRHKSCFQKNTFAARQALLIAVASRTEGFRYVFRRKASDPRIVSLGNHAYASELHPSWLNNMTVAPAADLNVIPSAGSAEQLADEYIDNAFLWGIDPQVWSSREAEDFVDCLSGSEDIVLVKPDRDKHICVSDVMESIRKDNYYNQISCLFLKGRSHSSSIFAPVFNRVGAVVQHFTHH
ncbi:Uncharacterised protein [BD1-7 clade bacterium]|uniref:Uncharacterized protein n=1 Tax=BD1-7 clade bacterium TaxID=2029982 RepID=A0A5S9R0L6_9GAMM|nr:Uncharacterised protein [BD1-7 clade bacterium]